MKAKFRFPFGKSIVGNYYNFLGILAGACLGMFIIYTPPLHVVFGGSVHLSPLYWLIPVAFGVLLVVWASVRVLLLRKGIEQSRVKDIKGLMMCTCVVSLNPPGRRVFTCGLGLCSPHIENDEHALEVRKPPLPPSTRNHASSSSPGCMPHDLKRGSFKKATLRRSWWGLGLDGVENVDRYS